MRKSFSSIGLIGGAFIISAQAPAPAPDALTLIQAQVRPIVRDPAGGPSGAAWEMLVADAAGAQFVIVGEQHGSGDIARLEAALHRELARRGFTHSALEVGPYSTAFAERLIRSGKGKLQSYIATPGHGFTLPFLAYAEEAEMAEAMVASSPDEKQALFGLDQEFVGAGPILAAELGTLARTAAQRKAVDAFAGASAKERLLVAKVDETELRPLEIAFASDRKALDMIEAMRTSARIYMPFLSGKGSGYAANLERETYMKRNFVRQFEAAAKHNGKAPKVFFKFGGNHAMRGFSDTNVPALANFIAEWGVPRGYRLVNLMVDCIGGQATSADGTIAPCESYLGPESLIRRSVEAGPARQIVDLRPLRKMLSRAKFDDASRKVILAFDYYVAVKDGAGATRVGNPAQ